MRVALIGAGMISHYHLIAWSKLSARASVVAIFDPILDRARERADTFGIPHAYDNADAMFSAEDIDALDIVAPREHHAGWVKAAMARGMAALCQKPLTPTLAEATALVGATRGRMRLMVHENWRFRPWYREMRKWLEAGLLGEVLAGHMLAFSSGLLPDAKGERPALLRQPFMAREGRLMITESLIHQLDVVRWLAGPEMRVVGARALHTVPEVVGETLAMIFLETSRGAPIMVSGTMAAPGFPPRGLDRFELIGERASAVLAGTELRLLGENTREIRFDSEDGYQASFDGVIAHFVHGLASDTPFETDPEDNLETLRLVEHAYWAAGPHLPASDVTRDGRDA